MKKIKALTIGAATLDTIIEYEDMLSINLQKKDNVNSFMLLEEGAKIEVTEFNSASGGGATNAAVSIKKLGIDVNFFGKVGKDLKSDVVLKELKEYGINTSNVKYSDILGTASSYVIPTLSGDRVIFAYRGANADIQKEDVPIQAIKEADFLYITSLSKNSASILPHIVEIAKQNNTKVAINPGNSQLALGKSFIKDAMFGIDTLVLNYQEAQKLMMSLLSTKDLNIIDSVNENTDNRLDGNDAIFQNSTFRLRDFFKLCFKLGPKTIVVTDGSSGVYIANNNEIIHSKALYVENVVNTLGAGDAFSSTFCANLYKGNSIVESLKYALINSAEVVKRKDAKSGLLNLEELNIIKEKIDKQVDENIGIRPL